MVEETRMTAPTMAEAGSDWVEWQHTPGPWGVEKIGSLWIGRVRSSGGFEQIVTKIDFHGHTAEAKTRKLADAHLISAAPALLEALEKIAGAHLGDQPANHPGSERDWAMQHIGQLRAIARDAVAAARCPS